MATQTASNPATNGQKETAMIQLDRLEPTVSTFAVIGISPLIQHAWSEKAIRVMEEGHARGNKSRAKNREPRNPEQEYLDAHYWFDREAGIAGIPASAFKKAMVSGCRFFDQISMVKARSMFFVRGEGETQRVRMSGESWMRTDPVSVGQSTDLRYRPQFDYWSAIVQIEFFANQIDSNSVANLLDAAGTGVGIGEWRPEKGGSNGRFQIVSPDEFEAYNTEHLG